MNHEHVRQIPDIKRASYGISPYTVRITQAQIRLKGSLTISINIHPILFILYKYKYKQNRKNKLAIQLCDS